MPGSRAVSEQDRRLKALHPAFRLVQDAGWFATWEGPLRPISQTYRVRIRYFARRFFEGFYIGEPYITVTVLEPLVGPDPRGTGEYPPHVYRFGHAPGFPALCLFDPRDDEWGPDQLIADTIVPWTVHWLYWFEVWLLTGEWQGGGRHVELTPEPWQQKDDSDPESAVRRAQWLNGAFHRIGRRLGVFGSYLSMAGGYAAYFPPRFSPSSNDATRPASPSAPISILSSEPPPAASWRLALVQGSPPPNCAICM